MKTKTKMNLNGSLAIGGGVLLGLGIGFFTLPINALYFVGSLISGIGIGLIIASFITKEVPTKGG